jgi:hypothetical protein
MSLRTTPETRFDSFEVFKTSYKRIGSHEIEVNVLVPKSIKSGKCPIVMKWPRRFSKFPHTQRPPTSPSPLADSRSRQQEQLSTTPDSPHISFLS